MQISFLSLRKGECKWQQEKITKAERLGRVDSLHLTPEAHKKLAEVFYKEIMDIVIGG